MNGHPQSFVPMSGATLVRADLRHPFLEPRQVLGVVLRTGLANPPVRVLGGAVQRAPRPKHLVACGACLDPYVRKTNVMHRFEELRVHGVDVDLLAPIRAEADPLENDGGLGEPRPHVRHEVLRRPAFLEVAGAIDLVLGEGVDERVKLRPEPDLVGEQRLVDRPPQHAFVHGADRRTPPFRAL